MEFAIVDNGFKVHDGRVLYEWLHLADGAGRRFCRAVAFRELTYLPIEMRDDPDMLGKQWAALRGLYNFGRRFAIFDSPKEKPRGCPLGSLARINQDLSHLGQSTSCRQTAVPVWVSDLKPAPKRSRRFGYLPRRASLWALL